MENLIKEITKYLKEAYNCHSIILYGSYASNNYTNESDIDIVCFCDNIIKENDNTIIKGKQLDVWFYETKMIKNIEQFLHIKDGNILLDERGLCNNFLKEINLFYEKGPKILTKDEKEFLKNWVKKMFIRSQKADIEGNYRFHWLITDSLEIYCNLKGIWYLGPKKTLEWLNKNDSDAFIIFNNALKINNDLMYLKDLVNLIIKL